MTAIYAQQQKNNNDNNNNKAMQIYVENKEHIYIK